MWMLGVIQHTETLHQRRVALEQKLKVVTHFITQMLCYVHKVFGRNKACMVKLVWSILAAGNQCASGFKMWNPKQMGCRMVAKSVFYTQSVLAYKVIQEFSLKCTFSPSWLDFRFLNFAVISGLKSEAKPNCSSSNGHLTFTSYFNSMRKYNICF